MNKLEYFDVKEYLEDRGITYWEYGKNVTEGWINIQCVFCDDRSNHLGIDPTTMFTACWKCGPHGPVTNIVREIEGCSYNQALEIIGYFQASYIQQTKKIGNKQDPGKDILPKYAGELRTIHKEYLISRGFDPEYLTEKYGLKACTDMGDYKYSIIVPVFVNGKVVNFTAMYLNRQQGYKHCPNEESHIPMKQCLYNIDTVKDTALVVEGVTDVWKMGDGTVAVMGMEYTVDQINLLYQTGVKKVVVMFDGEELAIKKANKFARALAGIIPIVEVIELDSGDPGDFLPEEVAKCRKIIFGY